MNLSTWNVLPQLLKIWENIRMRCSNLLHLSLYFLSYLKLSSFVDNENFFTVFMVARFCLCPVMDNSSSLFLVVLQLKHSFWYYEYYFVYAYVLRYRFYVQLCPWLFSNSKKNNNKKFSNMKVTLLLKVNITITT